MNENTKSVTQAEKAAEQRMIGILRSENSKAIIATIEEIRDKGKITILPEVFDLLQRSDDNEVLGACMDLLNDLNNQASVPYVISAIKDNNLKDIRHQLVSSCWQSNLDYSEHILLFTDLVIKDEYLVAIEALTVVENHIGDLDDKTIVDITSKLQGGLNKAAGEKKSLIQELLSTIKDY